MNSDMRSVSDLEMKQKKSRSGQGPLYPWRHQWQMTEESWAELVTVAAKTFNFLVAHVPVL